MDDQSEQVAAIAALSQSRQLFLERCEEPDMLDTLEELGVITTKEKEKADFSNSYEIVAVKFEERLEQDPQFLTEFCSKIFVKEDLKDLAESLLGESECAINFYKL